MSKKINILLAEDELALGRIIKESLETQNILVDFHTNGLSALRAYQNHKPDLLVLDVMMPTMDGMSLTKEIRQNDKVTPIIFLTARGQTKDVVAGFEVGCNDYIRKPFSIEELVVRINALLSRSRKENLIPENTQLGKYTFNTNKQTLHTDQKSYILTHREATLLHLLLENKNAVINRSDILQKIWATDDYFAGRSLDVFITKLRNKLKSDSSISIINVRGIGYKITY